MKKNNVLLELEKISNENNSSIAILAKYLLEYEGDISTLKIKNLVNLSYVSTATATRLAQKMGFSGFNELKICLSLENSSAKSTVQNFHNTSLENYLIEVNSSMYHTVANVNYSVITQVCEQILKSKNIHIFATGGTQLCAQDFSNKIKRIKLNAHCEIDTHNQYFNAKNSDEFDICIGISYSGATHEVITELNIAKNNKAKTCLITSNKSINEDTYDYVIYIAESETLTRNLSITSRTSILAILDIIYLEITNKNFDYYQEVLQNNHYSRT